MNIAAILKQPSTIQGIGAVAGVMTVFASHLAQQDTTVTVALGGLVFGIVHILMPDNTGAPSSVEKLVTDAATAVAQKRLALAMPQLLADTMAVVQSIQPAQTATVTTTTVATPAPVIPPAA